MTQKKSNLNRFLALKKQLKILVRISSYFLMYLKPATIIFKNHTKSSPK